MASGNSVSSARAESSDTTSTGNVSSRSQKKPRKQRLTKRQKRSKMGDQELLLHFEELVSKAASEPKCKGKSGCTCLHILQNEDYCIAVAKYLFWTERTKDKRSKDQTIAEWYIMCRQLPGTKGNPRGILYPIPFDGNGAAPEVDFGPLRDARMCSAAMGIIMEVKNNAMQSIRNASALGLMKAHGSLNNQINKITEDDPRMPPIRDHFDSLLQLGEVRATKAIRTLVEGMGGFKTSGDDDCVYLPCSSGKRPMFYRYARENGYKIVLGPRGKIEMLDRPGVEQKDIVDWRTYRRIWRREYPKLKVSTASEDLCEMCIRFRNRHQYLASHTKNLADRDIKIIEDEDIFGKSESEDDTPTENRKKASAEETNTTHDGDAKPDASPKTTDGDAKPAATPKPSLAKTSPTADSGAESDDSLTDPARQQKADELRTRADLFNAKLLLAAAEHIKMANAQRELYVKCAKEAAAHALENKPHSERTYTLVVDYAQNMDLPCYNSEQPGPVYYFSPLSIYACGVVDHGHIRR